MEKKNLNPVNPDMRDLHKLAGMSAILLGILYIIITGLYVMGGALPASTEEWLRHLSEHETAWWTILWLSVITDLLFLPVPWSLFQVLKAGNQHMIIAGAGFLVLFVVLDLAITWPNYSVLITLGNKYSSTLEESQKIILVTAATYAHEVLTSGLFAFYAILIPSFGILFIGLVMMKGIFSKPTAYLGISTGILGFISVLGAFINEALGVLAIPASILTTIWIFFVGFNLYKLGKG